MRVAHLTRVASIQRKGRWLPGLGDAMSRKILIRKHPFTGFGFLFTAPGSLRDSDGEKSNGVRWPSDAYDCDGYIHVSRYVRCATVKTALKKLRSEEHTSEL